MRPERITELFVEVDKQFKDQETKLLSVDKQLKLHDRQIECYKNLVNYLQADLEVTKGKLQQTRVYTYIILFAIILLRFF